MSQSTFAPPTSGEVYAAACRVIPGGVNSPVRSFSHLGTTPLMIESAYADEVIDLEGKSYIDFCMSWGALIHGHAHPLIVEAVQKRVAKGSSFGTTTLVETRIAQKVASLVPCVEEVRFVSSGTEATMSAARLARGATNRDLVIKFTGGYHGHADGFLIAAGSGLATLNLNSTSSSKGVPDAFVRSTLSLPYNDERSFLEAINRVGDRVACVIIEPVAGNMGVVPASSSFLKLLREETRKAGALLIFDEVITGFRIARGGASEVYGVEPDLVCLGKIVGGGFPAAAFGGKREIMEHLAPQGGVYQAGTLSGNPVAMEAGLQALTLLERDGFYEELQQKVDHFAEPIEQLIGEKDLPCVLNRVGSMFTLFLGKKKVATYEPDLDSSLFAEFFHALLDKGIFLSPSAYETSFISHAHTVRHLEQASDAICQFLKKKF